MNGMPLNDRDFAEIRSNVLREIARRQRRNSWVLAGSVAFAVLAMVFVLMPRRVENRAGEAAGAPPRTVAVPVAHLSGAPAASPVRVVAKHHLKPHHHHRAKTPPPIAIASSEGQPMTIELQTANPDVRIIWIARQETP